MRITAELAVFTGWATREEWIRVASAVESRNRKIWSELGLREKGQDGEIGIVFRCPIAEFDDLKAAIRDAATAPAAAGKGEVTSEG